jgi:hypothetical protein
MESHRSPISFASGLGRLQELFGTVLHVAVSADGCFSGVSFDSRLERIETLPPDDQVVILHFAHAQTIDLDPKEIEVFVGPRNPGQSFAIEFCIGTTMLLELSPDPPPDRLTHGLPSRY